MLDLPRITLVRQRRVSQSLAELAKDKAFVKTLQAPVREALTATVAAGAGLDPGREIPVLLLDTTTDAVFNALDDLLEAVEKGMTDRVIRPLTEPQGRKKAAATTLRQRAFPDGTGYLTESMALQYAAMRKTADALERDPECLAAVRELDLGWFVDHLVAHLGPYGRAVKAADGRDLEAESDAFHRALVTLTVQTSAHHGADDALTKQVFGAYQTELDAQREEDRAARRRAKKKPA